MFSQLIVVINTLFQFADPRPYVRIAVAETNNNRIQIFRFYWMSSLLYTPEIVLQCVIGGYKNEQGIQVKNVTSVSFSPTGELAVCDMGMKHVLLLSSTMTVLRKIKCPFVSYVPRDEIPSQYHRGPVAPPPSGGVVNYHAIENKDESRSPDGLDFSTVDNIPVSVAFAPDGKFAVGYRRGGVLIFHAYKSYETGAFCDCEVLSMFYFVLHIHP